MWWNCDIKPNLTLNPRLLLPHITKVWVILHGISLPFTLLLILKTPFHCTRFYGNKENVLHKSAFMQCLLSAIHCSGLATDEHYHCPWGVFNPSPGGYFKDNGLFVFVFVPRDAWTMSTAQRVTVNRPLDWGLRADRSDRFGPWNELTAS